MTLFYSVKKDSVIENHPEEWVSFDDDGRLVMDLSSIPREEKRLSLLKAAGDAIDASDAYELVSDAETRWIPEEER